MAQALQASPAAGLADRPVSELAAQTAPELAPARQVEGLSLVFADGQSAGRLLDGNASTKLTLAAGATLRLTAPAGQAMAGLYLIWDRPVEPWRLTTESGRQIWGNHGYLHEYAEIPGGAAWAEIQAPAAGGVLCDIYAFGAGSLPDWVQVWRPPHRRADILLLPTHSDDEHLFFGGTMPYYAGELGRKVQVAYLTHHWAEPYRPHELLNGLWTVGIRHYPVIGEFPDYYSDSLAHARTLYDRERMVEYQIGLLRRFRPLVVIGHDINGEYGHGVHRLNTDTLRQALEMSGDPAAAPDLARRYGVWDVPKTYLHLYPENNMLMDWDRPLARFDGATAFEMAEKGFACHVSQGRWFSVRRAGVHDCRSFGLYRSDRGPDLNGGDFMEGLAPYADGGTVRSVTLPRYGSTRYGLDMVWSIF
ncbi:MAG: PIG-L family deacetylase [Peptococcaceae bacterium]|nr:PIG-L family deacetylase [Peptococcaceae bacterium]